LEGKERGPSYGGKDFLLSLEGKERGPSYGGKELKNLFLRLFGDE